MSTAYPLVPTNTQIFAPQIVANGGVLIYNSPNFLNLREKEGARLLINIGRINNSTPTAAAYLAARNTDNNAFSFPGSQRFDTVMSSGTTAATGNTTASATLAGATTLTVGAITNFARGDLICISTSGGNIQWARIATTPSGTTLTLEEPLKLSVANGSNVVNFAETRTQYLEGGDIYDLRFQNYSGISLVIQCEAIIYNGYNIV